jgi:hypothetical protein
MIMAHMIPPRPPPPGPGYKAERLLYEALSDQLDDEFFVYNRLKYIEPMSVREGEADFLVVHRVGRRRGTSKKRRRRRRGTDITC